MCIYVYMCMCVCVYKLIHASFIKMYFIDTPDLQFQDSRINIPFLFSFKKLSENVREQKYEF